MVHFAYFAPYSYERHQRLVGRAALSPKCEASVIGKTLDGRDMDLLTLGNGPTNVWVIHRQHPGEPMAEWFAEGLVERLTSDEDDDPAVAKALKECTWHLVPNMNPDGACRGHLRVNGGGANLNREWAPTRLPTSHAFAPHLPAAGSSEDSEVIYEAPTAERSPEVLAALSKMDETGVDLFVDVHGDELVPLNFLAGMEGLPDWPTGKEASAGKRLEALQGAFAAAYARSASPGDMQVKYSYAPGDPGSANLAICSNQVAHRFDCLGVTLEQPFKDCASAPEPVRGWSPARAKALGAALVDAANHVRPMLRDDGAFWEKLDPEDAYVRPLEGDGDSAL